MRANHIAVSRAGPLVGAFVNGVDLSRPLREDDQAVIRQALAEHGVVFFRDQEMTEAQHIAFAENFGPININRFFTKVEGFPKIAEVRKEPHHKSNIGGGWHTDHSYDVEPALGSALYARIVPEIGGDTIFVNMAAVFEIAVTGVPADAGGAAGDAFVPPRVRQGPAAGDERRPRGPHRQSGTGDAGRGASGGDPPSGQRTEGAVRQSGFHHGDRGLAGG